MKNTYYIKTFGCQMNHSDSERIASVLENKSPSNSPFKKVGGFELAKNISEADLVIFNTCGVRQMAEDRVYGQIHNLRKSEIQISKSETKKIILTGCLANRKDVQRRLKDKVDLFCEIRNFQKEFQKIEFSPFVKGGLRGDFCKNEQYKNPSVLSGHLPFAKGENSKDYLKIIPKHKNNFSAHVPIMTGCNNFCAYCIVPYARGREVSRPTSEIIKEVESLVKNGCKEVILLGQNVNSYTDGKINFSKLLKKINALSGDFWIQFVSNHPKDVTSEMIESVAKCKKVCECFHLPIQSGNDGIIKKMNRKYTAKQYLNLIKKIKAAYKKYKPNELCAITSDIIVGFPGETKKKFLDSAEIMKKVKYDVVFFGQFSPRPGTAAWEMEDNISKSEKSRREKYLNEILKKTSFENNQKYVGKILEVLIDKSTVSNSRELEDTKGGKITYFGKTRTMKNVRLESTKKNLVGKIIKVKMIKANVWNLEGTF